MANKEDKPGAPLGWLVLLVRVALGGLFIFAGLMKLKDPQSFAEAINGFKVIPYETVHLITVSAFLTPWIEIVAGAMLIVGFWARSSALLIGLMLLAFIAAIASVLARGMEINCSCFGKFERPCTGPIGPCHLIRNGVLLAMALFVVWKGPGALAIDRQSTK